VSVGIGPVEAEPAEIRVLGCLIEKQRTTPDAYPLTLNSLRLACNQATNRDPVVDYDESTVRHALQRLSGRRWTRMASGAGSRAPKFRHLLDEALGLDARELSLLCVLMLRGGQTPGELKGRAERLHPFADLDAVESMLGGLIDRGLVERLQRRPGQKEERYAQLLGAAPEGGGEAPSPLAPAAAPADAASSLESRITRLEQELAALRSTVDELRRELGTRTSGAAAP
jgi:uncharacterized protein YceH (UPF0502 family)